jgi:MYXO-CTERM domain-containing protein
LIEVLFRIASSLGLLVVLVVPGLAYVRTTSTRSGVFLEWHERCVTVTTDARGSADIPLDVVDATLARSAANWSTRTDGCSYMTLSATPAYRSLDVANDGQPVVVFRYDVWQRPGSKQPHDSAAIGLTTVFYLDTPGQVGDGSILDADVELNGVNYTFITAPSQPDPPKPKKCAAGTDGACVADLENTLTHELGHVQGLAHTCWDHITPTPPLDDHNQPIPDCFGGILPMSITSTTMYPYSSTPGETSKRNLSPDDQRAICEIYQPSGAPPACYIAARGGCAVGGDGASWAAVAIAAAIALARRRRRA